MPSRIRVPAGAPPWVTPELLKLAKEEFQPKARRNLKPKDLLNLIVISGIVRSGLEEIREILDGEFVPEFDPQLLADKEATPKKH